MLRWFPAEGQFSGLVDLLPCGKPGNLKNENESDKQQADVYRKSDSQSTDECFRGTEPFPSALKNTVPMTATPVANDAC